MAAKRPPNPNTAYGRRKIQEEKFLKEQQWRNENPQEAANSDNLKVIGGLFVLFVIVALAIAIKMQGSNDHYGSYGGHYKINTKGIRNITRIKNNFKTYSFI